MSTHRKSLSLVAIVIAAICALGAAGIRTTGEIFIPDGVLKPRAWSSSAGDELTIALQQHAIDETFDFYKDDATAPPSSATWLVFSPRAAGVITNLDALIVNNGTSTDIDVLVKKNGTTQMASDLTLTHSSTENVWTAGSLTGGSFSFAADDLIQIAIVNTSATGAQGLKARLKGYYVGD